MFDSSINSFGGTIQIPPLWDQLQPMEISPPPITISLSLSAPSSTLHHLRIAVDLELYSLILYTSLIT
jgi:hypothetical protein